MRNHKVAAAMSFLLLAGCAHQPAKLTEAPKTKLYEMFQKYCVATGGQFDAVDKAAATDGFVNRTPLENLLHIESTTWVKGRDHITVGPGHRVKLGADGTDQPWPYDPPQTKADGCYVTLRADHDDSQALIAKWAGVPANKRPSGIKATVDPLDRSYAFRIENGKHIAVRYDEQPSAIKSGGYWDLQFYVRDNDYTVGGHHYYLPEKP